MAKNMKLGIAFYDRYLLTVDDAVRPVDDRVSSGKYIKKSLGLLFRGKKWL